MMLPFLVFTLVPVMVIVKKQVFVATVRSESHRSYTKPWKSTSEPIPPREGASIPPLLSAT